jgi:hypothetical protein
LLCHTQHNSIQQLSISKVVKISRGHPVYHCTLKFTTNEAINKPQYLCHTSSLLLAYLHKLNNSLRTDRSPRSTRRLLSTAHIPGDVHAPNRRNVCSCAQGPVYASRSISLEHYNFKQPFVSSSPLFPQCTRLLLAFHCAR